MHGHLNVKIEKKVFIIIHVFTTSVAQIIDVWVHTLFRI